MSNPPPAYQEVAASGSSYHNQPSAEKHSGKTQQAPPTSIAQSSGHSSGGDKVLKIWHAASGNSLITAADEKTPIYNVIDSRAPDEEEQRRQSQQVDEHFHKKGLERRDPSSSAASSETPDVAFAQQIHRERGQQQQQSPYYAPQQPQQKITDLWTLSVRRGGDRNGPILAKIKRHISTNSAVAIDLGPRGKTGIEQKSGFPHTKYTFTYEGRNFAWTKTHGAPNTSRLDSGNYVCKDDKKVIYAYSTSEDDRCDGSLSFEDNTIDEGLLDLMTITGMIMRDLDTERREPSYMRYGGAYGAGYGPYGNPYYSAGYGFYPYSMGMGMGYPIGFPLLI